MKLVWKTIPETVVGLLRELQLKNVYLLLTKDRKRRIYTWSNGATIRQLSEEQQDWLDRMDSAGMIREVPALTIPNSGTLVGTFYKLTPIGRYCAIEGKIPALGFAEPMNFQIRINNKVAKTYRENDGDLTRTLVHVTENSGGAFEVYAYRVDPETAAPLFEVDKFELSHYRPALVDLSETGESVRTHEVQTPVYKMVTTYGWPIVEVKDAVNF